MLETAMSLVEPIVDGVGDAIGAVILVFVALLTLPARILWDNSKKGKEAHEHLELDGEKSRLDELEAQKERLQTEIERNNIRWEGDPDDPSQPGALDQLHSIESKIDEIKTALENSE